jgi:uncharacterized Zn finger protein (UPF0148 family)
MDKWRFHSCPKCQGDIYNDDGEATCLQCGFRFQPERISPAAASAEVSNLKRNTGGHYGPRKEATRA